MRLVYASGSRVPSRSANSVHVMKMSAALSRTGHEVTLITADGDPGEPGVADPFSYYGVSPTFEVLRLPWIGVRGRGYHYGWRSAREARRRAPALVYGRYLPSCWLCAEAGLPVVYESHAPKDDRLSRLLLWRLVRSGRLARLVVITESLARHYREAGVPAELIQVVPDAADAPVGEAARLGTGGRLQVGYVGHLYPGRGLEVIDALAERSPWADFHLVGNVGRGVEREIERLRARPNVRIHGFVPPSETDRYRLGCDVLLAPYQRSVAVYGGGGDTSAWMSPLKIFEYMAAGRAILCSDLPVLREVLVHGETALLCPPDEPGAWVAALERLRDDVALRARLGRSAEARFRRFHTWTSRAKRVLEGLEVGP